MKQSTWRVSAFVDRVHQCIKRTTAAVESCQDSAKSDSQAGISRLRTVQLGAGFARKRISSAASMSPPCLVRADGAAPLRRSAAPSADICRFAEFFSVKPHSLRLLSRTTQDFLDRFSDDHGHGGHWWLLLNLVNQEQNRLQQTTAEQRFRKINRQTKNHRRSSHRSPHVVHGNTRCHAIQRDDQSRLYSARSKMTLLRVLDCDASGNVTFERVWYTPRALQ